MIDMRGSAGRLNRGYVGIPTFLRSAYCTDLHELGGGFAVLGVPFDEGSPFLPGSRFGPREIRQHSLRFGSDGLLDVDTGRVLLEGAVAGRRIVDIGDVDVWPTAPHRTFDALTETVRAVLARGTRPVLLGGDHAISYPAVRAFDQPIHVIQLDAHLDYGAAEDDFQFTNGQGFRLIHALPQVRSLTQIGIRSPRTRPADLRDARANGSTVVTMEAFRRGRIEDVLAHVPGGAPVHVSIDIDAFDMPLVPGCVSAEPGGLTDREMSALLAAIAERFAVRGFDLVEVNPTLDVRTGATSYLAALTIARFMGYLDAADGGKP